MRPEARADRNRGLRGRIFWFAWIAVVALATLRQSWTLRNVIHPDSRIAAVAGHDLLSLNGLAVYAENPRAQMGPLALVLALLPHLLYVIVVSLSIGLVLFLVVVSSGWSQSLAGRFTAIVAAPAFVVPWSQLATKGHADDALVVIGICWMLAALNTGRRAQIFIGFGIALLGKPTAIVAAPILLLESPMAALGAVGIAAAIWLPFLLHDVTAMSEAGKGIMPVGHGSLADYLGYPTGKTIPAWIRPGQLLLGLAATTLGQLRGRVAEGLVMAFAVRALLETNPAPAYSITLVALAILPDIRRGYPLFTASATVSFWLSQPVLQGAPGWPRLVSLGLIILVAGIAILNSDPQERDRRHGA